MHLSQQDIDDAKAMHAGQLQKQGNHQGQRPRLVVTGQTSFHSSSQEPICVNPAFSLNLESDEQPVQRKTSVGTSWEPVWHGWLNEASWITIINDEGHFNLQPTPEEREDMAARILFVGIRDGTGMVHAFTPIRPGQNAQLAPVDLGTLMVRSGTGKVRFTVNLFPK